MIGPTIVMMASETVVTDKGPLVPLKSTVAVWTAGWAPVDGDVGIAPLPGSPILLFHGEPMISWKGLRSSLSGSG